MQSKTISLSCRVSFKFIHKYFKVRCIFFKYIIYISLIYITIYYHIHIVLYAGSYTRVYATTQIRTVLGPCCSR